jgi:hypothetical protein
MNNQNLIPAEVLKERLASALESSLGEIPNEPLTPREFGRFLGGILSRVIDALVAETAGEQECVPRITQLAHAVEGSWKREWGDPQPPVITCPDLPGGVRPHIVCLCGSTKFKAAFREAEAAYALNGCIVLSVGLFGHADGIALTAEDKARLDELHKRKIDLADMVRVLNVGGYIGESTASEIAYAQAHGKPVTYTEPILNPQEPRERGS